MRHWVQYHNTERMGGPPRSRGVHSIVTNKKINDLPGDTIWLIAGEGKPRTYTVCGRFVVDGVEQIDDPEFDYVISGHEGYRFRRYAVLHDCSWFPELLRRTNNFSLGLSRLTEAEVAGLQQLEADDKNQKRR